MYLIDQLFVQKTIRRRENFAALGDVNFTIEACGVIGIIGHKVTGKSILLKNLVGISKLTKD
jgi:ABC-type polysaccharide/polyol phosphate transport system ATPase subunit